MLVEKNREMKRLVFIILVLLSSNTFCQIIIDESYKEESFWVFKNQLESAILNKNLVKLKVLLADRINVSKDDCAYNGCPKDEFIKMIFADTTNEEYTDGVWNEFLRIIRFGFYVQIDENKEYPVLHDELVFKAPSYLKTTDLGNSVLILAENVNIREKPSLSAKIIRKATFEKFDCDCNIMTYQNTTFQKKEGIDWLEIKLGKNKIGYVAVKYTSYSISKQLTIGKVKGRWKIISYYHPPGC